MLLARGLGGMVLVIPLLAAIVVARQGIVPTDMVVYLAGGERLNAGHDLYALAASDRPIKLEAVYGYSPLLSPPLVAILFRPLALLGDLGAWIWWAAAAGAMFALLAWIIWLAPLRGALVVALLTVPIYWQIASGNVNAFVAVLLTLAWHLRGTAWSGVATSIAASVKVIPVALLPWTRQWRAAGTTLLALAVLTVIGAGPQSILGYIQSASHAQPSGLSVGGLMTSLGLATELASAAPFLILAIGMIAAFKLPDRPGFVVGVLAMVFGSPSVNVHTYALLVIALVPFIDRPVRPVETGGGAVQSRRTAVWP